LPFSFIATAITNSPKPKLKRDARYFSGILTGILSGFLIYCFLEPLFFPVGLNLAVVALWVLAIMSALAGMSLGVLLPTLFPGLCFGVNLALLGGCFFNGHSVLYFPVAGGVLALAGALVSVR
jgi:callose synthase